jgi:hypothetical protein
LKNLGKQNNKAGNLIKTFYSFLFGFPYFFIWISGIRQKKQKKSLFLDFRDFSLDFKDIRHAVMNLKKL